MDPAPQPKAARIGQYVNKAKRSRDIKRVLFATADKEAPSTSKWQKSKRTAVGKIKAKLGEEKFLRIRDQYIPNQNPSWMTPCL